MTWDDDAGSVEDSDQREGYVFEFPSVTIRLARGDEDVVIDGATFRASPIGRDEMPRASASGKQELVLKLPITHDVVRRYVNHGIPPMFCRVRVYLKQARSGEARTVWVGSIISAAIDGSMVSFLVPSRIGQSLERRISTITAGRSCAHVLYDGNCRAPMSGANLLTLTINVANGPTLLLTGTVPPVPWTAIDGMVIHPATGERRTVRTQTGNIIEMQMGIPGAQSGDTVLVARGCNHTVGVCQGIFNNIVNYGGQPVMPTKNPFLPGKNLGVIES